MKILATFDGSEHAEAILPILSRMAALPDAEIVLVGVAHEPGARAARGARRTSVVGGMPGSTPMVVRAPDPGFIETKSQAIQRAHAELEDYLNGIAAQLPEGTRVSVEAHIADHPAKMIIDVAREDQPDVIVMATRGLTGVRHVLFGSTTEAVIQSGVAPVLVVHPPG